MFIYIFVLTLSLISKLQAFWYFILCFKIFCFSFKLIFPERPSTNYSYITTFNGVLYSTYYFYIFLLLHGDIEANPRPAKKKLKNLSCCHWNVNSLIAHRLSKISLLKAYNVI